MLQFSSLHVHSSYSFLDGYGLPNQYIDRLEAIKQDSIAITDHGNIYAHIPFTKVFQKANKHLVYGCEFYIVEKLYNERGYNHITVLAKNNTGYANLLKLANVSYQQKYYKPRITFDQLVENSKGLIILSGCVVDGYLHTGDPEWWLNKFKKCEWYVELQPFVDEKEKWSKLATLAKKKGLPCLVTFDSHYPKSEDKQTHDFMLAINTNKPLSDPDRLKMDYPLHIPSIDEVIQRCKEMGKYKKEWITDTHKIAQKCKVELPKTSLVKINAKIDDIKKECYIKLKKKKLNNKIYIERLEHELKLIKDKKFEDYFAIITDLMKWAKQRMLCSPGRGSSAGSLVCYLLGITEVDSIKYNLLFERFIDINRADLPDIDLDFPASKRGHVIEYLKNKYGEKNTVQLVTFNTFKPRAIIQDAARVLKIPQWEIKDAASQLIERSSGDSRSENCLKDSIKEYDNLKKLFVKYPELNHSINLEGQIRQTGKGAAAVAIAADAIGDIGLIVDGVLGIDKYNAENYGLLKIDILGLETLDIIMDICNEVGFDWKKFYTIPLDDEKIYKEVFCINKLIGIFQFEGLSVKQMCNHIKPTAFEQLVHINALGRPGAIGSGSFKDYIERSKGKKYDIDQAIKPYTEKTFGIAIFQEQVMSIVKNIGNFSWEDTSTIRKAMSKNLGMEFFDKFRDKFVKGADKNGVDKDRAIAIWKQCYTHGQWCIAGDTKIKLPTANQYSPKEITIKQLFENGGRGKICKYWKNKDNYAKIFSLNLDTDIIKPQQLMKVFYNGKKEIYQLTTDSGKKIKATFHHNFLTKYGWKQLKELIPLMEIAVLGDHIHKKRKNRNLGKGAHNRKNKDKWRTVEYEINRIKIFEKQKGYCAVCKTILNINNWETHHKDKNKANNKIKNLESLCRKCHKSKHEHHISWSSGCQMKWEKINNIKYIGIEDVYDIEMPSPYHNYIANDFVVHNSFNASHAVSYSLLSYWTAYCKVYWPAQFYARILKGEIDENKIQMILKEYNGKIIPIDINRSEMYFRADKDGKTLIGGFTNIKGIGEKAAQKITDAQPFKSVEDFKSRMPKGIASKITEALDGGLLWANTQSMAQIVKEKLTKIKLSLPLSSFKNLNSSEVIALGRVIHINLKNHNEDQKVLKRGYKMDGYTEYIVLKVYDDDYNIYHVCFDRYFTQQNKQMLLELKNKICLFKVAKKGEIVFGKSVRSLQ